MKTTLTIPGMHCAGCAALVKDVSSEFPQIKSVDVDMEKKVVTIDHDEGFNMQAWTKEIESLGEDYKIHP